MSENIFPFEPGEIIPDFDLPAGTETTDEDKASEQPTGKLSLDGGIPASGVTLRFTDGSGNTVDPSLNGYASLHGFNNAATPMFGGANHYAGNLPWMYPPIGHDSGPELVMLPKGATVYPSTPATPSLTEAQVRVVFREELEKIFGGIAQEGLADARHFALVSIKVPSTGEEYRGMVYLREKVE